MVCRCAQKTKARGYGFFGLQFYGECWSGPNAQSRFAMHGPSKKCIMGLAIPPLYCNRTSPRPCVGVSHTNYIYKIQGAGPTPCSRDLDLAILLDSSSSIGQARYKTAKEFLADLLAYTRGSIRGTRIGIIVYNQEPHLQVTFNQTAVHTLGDVIESIRSMPYLRGGTRTDKALHAAAVELYTQQGGDRDEVANVLLVVTDGRTSHLSQPYVDALKPLKDRKVHVIAVGVGQGVNKSELLQIAMGRQDHVVTVADYKDLYGKLSDIVDNVCDAGRGKR
ncbi:hypothetical protein QZH41_013934 [Actinostola sp. cb2023]|nr:hypothetical protein QZH41_013934 [Actinostola sp. cb2023]